MNHVTQLNLKERNIQNKLQKSTKFLSVTLNEILNWNEHFWSLCQLASVLIWHSMRVCLETKFSLCNTWHNNNNINQAMGFSASSPWHWISSLNFKRIFRSFSGFVQIVTWNTLSIELFFKMKIPLFWL